MDSNDNTTDRRKFTVGQTLWFVPAHGYTPREVTITKIGRKWMTVTAPGFREIRIDAETLYPHEADTRGQAYLSKEVYEAGVALSEKWRKFQKAIDGHWQVPYGLTVEKIEQAMSLLGLEWKL